jgi:phosphoribosyl-ATP pyrophosphohydrolase/phosphoribosyl-AMP cyclohydrolase
VKWFGQNEIIADDVVELAKKYSDLGADELIVFDLSTNDKDHDDAIDLMKKMNRVIHIPMIAGGNIKRQEDVKKILYAGAKRAIINFAKPAGIELIEEVSKRFGKEKIAVSLNDFDTLFKQQALIDEYASEIIFMHRPDLESVKSFSNLPTVILTDVMDKEEIFRIFKYDGIKGVSGKYVSQYDFNFDSFTFNNANNKCSVPTLACPKSNA